MGLLCKKPVRALICTGSDALAESLRELLLRWARGMCVTLSIVRTEDIPVQWEEDLLFLDMDSAEPPENGWIGEKTSLIVVSRDAGRAIRSYRLHPAAFLKPDCDAYALAEALSACEGSWQQGRLCLESPYRRRALRLTLGKVSYIEAAAHYCIFEQAGRFVRARFAAGELEELLPKPPFARCHRSYFVHLDAVVNMSYTVLTLKGGVCLPVGRTYVQSLREALRIWKEGKLCDDSLRIAL